MNSTKRVASAWILVIFFLFLGLGTANAQGEIDPSLLGPKVDPSLNGQKIDPLLQEPKVGPQDSIRVFTVGTEKFSVRTVQNTDCWGGKGFTTDHVYLNGQELPVKYAVRSTAGSPCRVVNIYRYSKNQDQLVIETVEGIIEDRSYLHFYEKEGGHYVHLYSKPK